MSARAEAVERVVALLQELATSTEDLSRAFGAQHSIHRTDARAIVELMDGMRSEAAMTSGQLAIRLGLTPATVTSLVDRLVDAGHVRRESDPTDRRRVLLVVEESALGLGRSFYGPLAAELTNRMDGYSDAEIDVVERFLRDASGANRDHLARVERA